MVWAGMFSLPPEQAVVGQLADHTWPTCWPGWTGGTAWMLHPGLLVCPLWLQQICRLRGWGIPGLLSSDTRPGNGTGSSQPENEGILS